MKKLLSLILCLAMISSMVLVFSGCGSDSETSEETKEVAETPEETQASETNGETSAETEAQTEAQTEEEKTDIGIPQNSTFPKKLKAEKLVSVNKTYLNLSDFGYSYEEGDKTGIASYNGKNDTGAKYTDVEEDNGYYIVSLRTEPYDLEKIDTLNDYGLIDANGKEIIPCEYALIKVLSDRYVEVIKATEQTTNRDECLLYVSSSQFGSIIPSDDDILFKGIWSVFDLKENKFVEGATGTNFQIILCYGDIICYRDEKDDSDVVLGSNGQKLNIGEFNSPFKNGTYAIENILYDANGEIVFECNNKYNIEDISDNYKYYIISRKEDGRKIYSIVNQKGEIVSGEFKIPIEIYGELVKSDERVYDFSVNQIIDSRFDYVERREICGVTYYVLGYKDKYTLLDSTLNVVLEIETNEKVKLSNSKLMIYNDSDYYCFATKEYIDGARYSLGDAMVVNDDYQVIDLLSGEVLVEGYRDYTAYSADDCIYLAATKGQTTDIYKITVG